MQTILEILAYTFVLLLALFGAIAIVGSLYDAWQSGANSRNSHASNM